jgi:signal transduction histidine kinase
MWTDFDELIKEVRQESWAKDLPVSEAFWPALVNWLGERVLSDFLATITRKVDEIVEIDADLKEPEILEKATRRIVDFLGAHSASVRIYDPHTEQMLSYGSFPSEEGTRQTYIPLEGSVAGEVVRTKKTFIVSDILKEPRYRNKQIVTRKGVHSLMAIPLEITRFFPHERDTAGVIQIYFPEKGRTFSRLEIQVANLLAKRLGFVIARKKIFSMHRVNEKKESIVRHIFKALGTRGGIKMKDVFNRVIPELAYIVNLQSCALFSVTESLDSVVLEAGYPERDGYHSIGKRFPISIEPAFEMLLNLADYTGESDYDILTPSYILVADPRRSRLTSENMKQFATYHNINSILYIPLRVNGETTHFMTFDAIDQRQRYMEDEIEIFLFLGRELMKAQKMERLDDILHDFKNPAIATAGFARRLKQILERGDLEGSRDQLLKYVDIVLAETSRLQELALSIYQVGEEQVVSLTEVLQRRFEINKEAIKEQLKQNVSLKEGPFDPELHVRCYPIHLERIFDNLLNNATKAIPLKGGFLSIRTYGEEDWAYAEITNTGGISDEDRLKLLAGEGSGRGLYITYRIMRLIRGKLEIRGGKNSTTFIVGLPIHRGEPKD